MLLPHPGAALWGDAAGEVVCFVRAGDALMIGRTSNLGARLRELATASAVPLKLLAAGLGGRQLAPAQACPRRKPLESPG
jgi:hypothetical protein